MELQRLDKVIASTGKWSRREVKLLVKQGRVLVDGFPAKTPEDKVDPEAVEIAVNGEILTYRKYTWVMLNKPAGYLSATEDGKGAWEIELVESRQIIRREFTYTLENNQLEISFPDGSMQKFQVEMKKGNLLLLGAENYSLKPIK